MKPHLPSLTFVIGLLLAAHTAVAQENAPASASKPRVLVSTDIGGTDPDDFQSLVHLLVYADRFDIEGLISSPYGPGRKEHILQVIDFYAKDYANLKSHSPHYPTPESLKATAKEGALDSTGPAGFGTPTEGSDWIVRCARRDDPRPLHVLVWGGIDDLAQALHDAPEILPKLRVYFIGGPNKMWSVNAYHYIEQNHPKLWIIEANSTYRGWFVGGNQSGEWGNKSFVTAHIAGRGALGDFFASQLSGTIKMGDSPSVGWLLRGAPEDPSQPGWGGQFVRVWDGRRSVFNRLTTEADQVEVFGVVEFELPVPRGMTSENTAKLVFDNRVPAPVANDGRLLRCRFSPRDAKAWTYVVSSDFAPLNGQSGKFTAVPPPAERTNQPSPTHPNWWTDDPAPAAAEGIHPGAKSVNRWREDFLRDFAARMRRCQAPAGN
jgi:Cellulose-binding Sde182, nucleoside hydrolase-like domain